MKGLILVLFVLTLVPLAAVAQQTGADIQWDQLGVDVVLIGMVIGVVQFVKTQFLKTVKPVIPWLITIALSVLVGVFKNWGAPMESMVQVGFGYAFAATWLYEGGKSLAKMTKD